MMAISWGYEALRLSNRIASSRSPPPLTKVEVYALELRWEAWARAGLCLAALSKGLSWEASLQRDCVVSVGLDGGMLPACPGEWELGCWGCCFYVLCC